jgi:hypothetical protein
MYALDDPPLRIAECGDFYSAGMSGLGTNRTSQGGLTMSVDRR